MFTVRLYNFSKKENSTARPSSGARSFSCIVKTGTGILNPTIELDIGLTESPAQYNYAYIVEFGRYYFIEEWTFSPALWTAHLSVDVLATYKTEIGGASLYALRAANNYDGSIIDNLYPTKTGCTFSRDVLQIPWAGTVDRGVFILGIVTKTSHYGSIDYYAVGSEDMAGIVDSLMNDVVVDTNGFNTTDASLALQLNLIDPLQYIKSCIYIPVAIGNIPGSTGGGNVTFYNYDIPVRSYKRLGATPYFTKTLTFTIPKHPQTNARGNFVNVSPYTNIVVSIPPFGEFEIDTTYTSNASEITANIRVDVPTGRAILSLYVGNTLLQKSETNLGVSVQLSQVSRDYLGAATGSLGAIGNALKGDFMGAINGIGNAYTSMIPKSKSTGQGGSYAQFLEAPRLDAQFFTCVDDDITQNGRPLCKMITPASLGGYMLIQDGDVATNGTAAENKAIKNYLETGFYYQ